MQGYNMGRHYPLDEDGNPIPMNKRSAVRRRFLENNTEGTIVVRFEMPFAIWCTNCKPHETIIGQGVRFNAQKTKIGNYYSTPIWKFRMKHGHCHGWIEIHSDPKNTDYVVVSGARKRVYGDGGDGGDGVPTVGSSWAPQLIGGKFVWNDGTDGMDPLERVAKKETDRIQVETERSRIEGLKMRQDRIWDDPYEKSRRLRRTFRDERKGIERADADREALKNKMSLDIEVVDENEEDRARAGLVDFGPRSSLTARLRPLFESFASSPKDVLPDGDPGPSTRRGMAELAARRKITFQQELTGNTRAAVDPFLLSTADENAFQPEIKRRKVNPSAKAPVSKPSDSEYDRVEGSSSNAINVDEVNTPQEMDFPDKLVPTKKKTAGRVPLVDYSSDSS